jgi:hypothetical protein
MGMRLLKCLLILASIVGSNAVFGQIKITGTVSESGSNEKLTGVTVLIKNTQDGVVTELDGTFELTVPNEKSVLVISLSGHGNKGNFSWKYAHFSNIIKSFLLSDG